MGRRGYITVEAVADVDIDISDIIEEIDDDDLIAEMEERGLTIEQDGSTPVLVKMIAANYNIIKAAKVIEFFNELNKE